MAETIPLERDGRALAIKVLEGAIEHYRVAVTIPATQGRVRFLVDGTRIDGELRWLHADSQSLQAMADERIRVSAGTYQKADGTHELDWLICPGYPTVARQARETLIRQTWREMPTTLKFLGFGSTVAGLVSPDAQGFIRLGAPLRNRRSIGSLRRSIRVADGS
ncbi:hypothetical protein J2797_006697 [Paraburkholderia terricola]|uniref:hypothetical protein n=1 Tax=Paraburkholderia terricola TaxID=169427 RepID=UPI0028604930|nr:hypothetical protein [Paraburkholderia terricola]MDR6496770.1 hypothetical protein [Paraburkholderia terricola]